MRIGTRASALALAQAEAVLTALRAAGVDAELVTVTTLGDRGAAPQDKSRWVSELERALLDGRIDLAVHSAKDVPSDLEPGTELVAVPPRADPRDVIVGAESLTALADGSRVGTSSVRRAAQLRATRPDLDVVALRGNVDTRLRKLAEGEVDALVLALAGLERLGRRHEAGAPLEDFVPAPGQGALALQARQGSREGAEAARAVNDPGAMRALSAERTLVAALQASCHTPVGAFARAATTSGDGTALSLSAWVGLPDGAEWLADELTGPADAVGGECAGRMLAAGARELLARAEAELAAS